MSLVNSWIGYVDRSYEQIKANVLLNFGNLVPEITDHTDSNPWVKGINVFAGIAEMLGYYLDVNAREVYLSTARQFRSAIKIARFFDYRSRGAIAATVDVKFFIDAPTIADITIPADSQVSTKEGVKFLTQSEVKILIGQTEVTVSATQHTAVTGVALGTSDGSPNQIYVLEEDVEHESLAVLVDVTPYTQIDTFANAIDTDEIYIAELNEERQMQIEFGDDINGKIPPSTLDITADYFITQGTIGNVAAETITVIDSSITVPGGVTLKVTNIEGASGGVDADDLTTLQKKIPLANRTKYRAVTEQDFIDVTELAPGVEKAGVLYDCGKFVEVYIVPEGGGIASGALITSVTDWLKARKIITTSVNVLSAGEVLVEFQIDVVAIPNQQNSVVEQAIRDNLDTFFLPENQTISGNVFLSDIYQTVENTTGVSNSNINIMKAVPYARPINNTDALDWDRDIQVSSNETVKWEIRFTAVDTFELLRNSTFVGTFMVGIEVSLTEVDFTINSNSTIGHRYEFYTYKYFGNLVLVEPSIPGVDQTLVSLNVVGGI